MYRTLSQRYIISTMLDRKWMAWLNLLTRTKAGREVIWLQQGWWTYSSPKMAKKAITTGKHEKCIERNCDVSPTHQLLETSKPHLAPFSWLQILSFPLEFAQTVFPSMHRITRTPNHKFLMLKWTRMTNSFCQHTSSVQGWSRFWRSYSSELL